MGKFSQCDLMAFWTIIYSINFSTLYLFHKKSETKNKNVLILLHTWPKIHSYKPHYTTFYKGIQLLKTFLKLANCTFYHLQNVNRSQKTKKTHTKPEQVRKSCIAKIFIPKFHKTIPIGNTLVQKPCGIYWKRVNNLQQ